MPPMCMRRQPTACESNMLFPTGSDWLTPLTTSVVTSTYRHLAFIGRRLTKTFPSKACSAIMASQHYRRSDIDFRISKHYIRALPQPQPICRGFLFAQAAQAFYFLKTSLRNPRKPFFPDFITFCATKWHPLFYRCLDKFSGCLWVSQGKKCVPLHHVST